MKKKIKYGDIIILHMCNKNYDQMMYGSWDMVCNRQTGGRTDGQKKWHIELGAPPKNRPKNENISQGRGSECQNRQRIDWRAGRREKLWVWNLVETCKGDKPNGSNNDQKSSSKNWLKNKGKQWKRLPREGKWIKGTLMQIWKSPYLI